MKKVNSVTIKYDLNHSTTFEDANVLSGNILVSDNGYFEGIVSSKTVEQMFVFGMYLKNNFTELNQIVDGRIYRFHTDGKENSQQGYFGEESILHFYPQGSCQISIKDTSTTTKESLEKQLDEAKLGLVEYNKIFYEKVRSNENNYLEKMKKEYAKQTAIQFVKKTDYKPQADELPF